MNKTLLALYGLKWNPFAPEVPVEALHATAKVDAFCWRMENLCREGGFALVSGDPGTGKSVALRILCERLAALRDVHVGLLTRPQARLADFYREMGDLFGVPLVPHNRWAGAKALRETWQAHIDAALCRTLPGAPPTEVKRGRAYRASQAWWIRLDRRHEDRRRDGAEESVEPLSAPGDPGRDRDRARSREAHCADHAGARG